MKAEHRKELETNALADWLGRALQSSKDGSKKRYLWLAVAALIAVAIGYFAWRYYDNKKGASGRWLKLDGAASLADLEQFAKDNKGTMAARAARFEEARALLGQGMQNL